MKMSDIKSRDDMKSAESSAASAATAAPVRYSIRDNLGLFYAIGNLKNAVARLCNKTGKCKVVVLCYKLSRFTFYPVTSFYFLLSTFYNKG